MALEHRTEPLAAVQFHPEATPAAMENWLEAFAEELDPAVAERMRRGMEADPERSIARAYALYDSFLALAEITPPTPSESKTL